MIVVHINIGLGGGGAEHIILELAKRGNLDNIKTIVIAISDIKQIESKFIEQNIEIHYLNVNSFKSFFSGLKKLNSILNPYEDIILHCHMVHGLIMGVFYRLSYRKLPIIFTLHNILVEHLYRRVFLFLTIPIREIDINFSESSNKWYLKPVHVIANGVDFERFELNKTRRYNKETDKFVFLFLGRIEEQKNPLHLIKLVSKLKNCVKNTFEIHIVGDGLLRSELEGLIIKNNFQSHIKILGFQPDIEDIMKNSHCLILPSLWEGLPISLIEASASKLPIITTPVGSIPEYFNNSNCYIAELSSFHLSMHEVMLNYEEATNRAEKLYLDNKSIFDIESVYQKHKAIYTNLVNHNKIKSIKP